VYHEQKSFPHREKLPTNPLDTCWIWYNVLLLLGTEQSD
jgi:hypothetical protein